MDNEMLEKQAQRTYETICEMFDEMGFHYVAHDDDRVITCTIHGDDIPMEFTIFVFPKRQIVSFISNLPFTVPEELRPDMAMAVATANNGLMDGNFDFSIDSGRIRYRQTECYIDSILGKEMFRYMISVAASTVDDYNDKFLMMCKGYMTLSQFLEAEEELSAGNSGAEAEEDSSEDDE
ncbi:MAG: YbjN domain-containing protein [Ruminococcus sp.]|nr:YbjN domain-containing protein [Ruminococcus sp.]